MTILVIDVGSSSTRALLVDERAEPIEGAVASRKHSFDVRNDGAATADADHLRTFTEACIDEVLQHDAATGIRGVGMATFVGNIVGVDAKNAALTPVFTYADSRSANDVLTMRGLVDVGAAHQRTGCILHTAYLPARFHWLKRTQPQAFERVFQWVDLGTYLYRHWFDANCPGSYSVASWSGLLHRDTLIWDAEWLDTLGMSADMLNPLADYSAAQVGCKRWPKLANVSFFLAVGDGAAANIGSGAVGVGQMALTVGTTAALRVVSDGDPPHVPNGLWSYRVDAAHHLTGGATTEGGGVFEWLAQTFRLPDDPAEVNAVLERATPDGHGLTFLPLMAGERAPGWATHATGSLVGLRSSSTPTDIVQAALEGVALRLSLIADLLSDDDTTVFAGGGALAASPPWTQMIANALNRPLHLLSTGETTARGVAILAMRALGDCALTDYTPTANQIVEPVPTHVARLHAARARLQSLYDHMLASVDTP